MLYRWSIYKFIFNLLCSFIHPLDLEFYRNVYKPPKNYKDWQEFKPELYPGINSNYRLFLRYVIEQISDLLYC